MTYTGLKKRIDVEQKRRKALTIKRKLAKWLQETLDQIEKLERKGAGAYTEPDKDS